MRLNLRGDYVNKLIAEGHPDPQSLRLIEYGIISEYFSGPNGIGMYAGWGYSAAKGRWPKEYEEIKKAIMCKG